MDSQYQQLTFCKHFCNIVYDTATFNKIYANGMALSLVHQEMYIMKDNAEEVPSISYLCYVNEYY